MDFYETHKGTLDKALATIASRDYWSPYPESPRAYGEDAPAAGEAAFQERLGKTFELDQPGEGRWRWPRVSLRPRSGCQLSRDRSRRTRCGGVCRHG